MARTKRMRGYNVLHPFGWDAFGLPAENAAIKSGIHPEMSTLGNIAHMKGQLQRLGISYAWERELATCEPDVLQVEPVALHQDVRARAGLPPALVGELVPRRTRPCSPTSRSSTAAAGAAARRSRRAISSSGSSASPHTPTSCSKGIEQLAQWPEKVLTMQRNWIGRSRGGAREVSCARRRGFAAVSDAIEVFTTRIDTIFGATFVLLAPEHPLVEQFATIVRRSGGVPQAGAGVPHAGPHGAAERRDREGRLRHRPVRASIRSPDERGPDLGRELRARRIRHRRGHGGAGARPARLRVRAQVRPADQGRRARRIGSSARVRRR